MSASGPNTAAIAPLSACETWVISRPRALTASSAASNVSAPEATSAPYSPRLWPMTRSGVIPYAASSWAMAASVVSTAGWVISVCSSWALRRVTASGSAASANT